MKRIKKKGIMLNQPHNTLHPLKALKQAHSMPACSLLGLPEPYLGFWHSHQLEPKEIVENGKRKMSHMKPDL